jgi:hypothetical protein
MKRANTNLRSLPQPACRRITFTSPCDHEEILRQISEKYDAPSV